MLYLLQYNCNCSHKFLEAIQIATVVHIDRRTDQLNCYEMQLKFCMKHSKCARNNCILRTTVSTRPIIRTVAFSFLYDHVYTIVGSLLN
jgi:hypothetical protein